MPWPNDSTPLFPGQAGSPLSNQHLSVHQNLANAVAGILAYLGLPPNVGGTALLSRLAVNPSIGTIFWLGASYEDELNFYVIQGLGAPYPVAAFSNSNTWAHLVNGYFGQPCLGRYAGPAGSLTGQNYAVGGSGTFGTNNIGSQIAQLIADYGGTLPANSVVVLGAYWPNDLIGPIQSYGGMWAPPSGPQSWAVSHTGAFVTPSSGTLVVNVVSSTGMVIGQNISFAAGGIYYGPSPITATPSGTQVTIGVGTYVGVSIPNDAVIVPTAAGQMLNQVSGGGFNTAISNLVAALPATGLLVIVNSPDASLLPVFSSYGQSSTNVHNTWLWYKVNIIAPLLATTAPKVAGWDMNQTLVNVVTNFPPANGVPGPSGFKNVNAGLGWTLLNGVPAGYNADDWIFVDGTTGVSTTGVHPTGAMHALYATDFIKFLTIRKRVSVQ